MTAADGAIWIATPCAFCLHPQAEISGSDWLGGQWWMCTSWCFDMFLRWQHALILDRAPATARLLEHQTYLELLRAEQKARR